MRLLRRRQKLPSRLMTLGELSRILFPTSTKHCVTLFIDIRPAKQKANLIVYTLAYPTSTIIALRIITPAQILRSRRVEHKPPSEKSSPVSAAGSWNSCSEKPFVPPTTMKTEPQAAEPADKLKVGWDAAREAVRDSCTRNKTRRFRD